MTRHAPAHDTYSSGWRRRIIHFSIAGCRRGPTHFNQEMIGKLNVYYDAMFSLFCRNDQACVCRHCSILETIT